MKYWNAFIEILKNLFPKKSQPKPPAPVELPPVVESTKAIEDQIEQVIDQNIWFYKNIIAYSNDKNLWKRVMKSMSFAESGFNPFLVYPEKDIKELDAVTGKPNLSEGLFQLSQQDAKIHGAPFDWSTDKFKAQDDKTKTIFGITNNTIAALKILDKQLAVRKTLITDGNPYYWAVLDTSRAGHKTYLEKLKSYPILPVDPIVPEQSPVEEKPVPTPVNTESKIKIVAIIIGHGAGDSGAVGNGTNEFAYNSKVAKLVQESKEHGKKVFLFFRDSRGIGGVNSDVQKFNDDLSIELHCNSFNGIAKGCEILTLANDEVSIKVGQDLAEKFCKRFNRIKRDGDGVKELKKKDRGHYSMSLVDDPAPSVLFEPFFIDNPEEFISVEEIAEFLIDYLKGI